MSSDESNRRNEFVRQLEQLVVNSTLRQDLDSYLAAAHAAENASRECFMRRLIIAKQATLAAAFVMAFLQYYLLDVYVQILSMRPVALVTAHRAPVQSSTMISNLRFWAVRDGKPGSEVTDRLA
jgi:hypothetical protein